MKKTIVSTNRLMILAMMMVMTISARSAMPLGSSKNAMSYNAAKNEALFLSDKMAYELNLTDAQYDAVYEINLDYLMSVNGHNDVFGIWWDRRNADLRFVLNSWQYDKYAALNYFYRPLSWNAGAWVFNIYSHYTNRNHFYKARPTVFVSYRGGNNRKATHFYADRRVVKPAPKASAAKPAHNGSTWRVTNAGNAHHNATARVNGHNNNRQLAQNSNNGKKSSHFLRPDGSKRAELERGGRR